MTECRELLLRGSDSDAMWVGGKVSDTPELGENGLREIYRRRMEQVLGSPRNMHNSRHAFLSGFIRWTGGSEAGDFLTASHLMLSNDLTVLERHYRVNMGADEHEHVEKFTAEKTRRVRRENDHREEPKS